MQKKIIVLAIAAALTAPALAFAAADATPEGHVTSKGSVIVYGQANLSYDMVSTGTGTAVGVPAGLTSNRVSSNQSRIGLNGSEDLGNGLSAVWQVESLVAMDEAGGTFGTRNTFLGLSSKDMGTVVLGKHDTPYKISTRRFDVFADGIADNRSLMGTSGILPVYNFDGRQPDVVAYISPAISGFTGAIAYVNLTETNSNVTDIKISALSLAGMYDAAPFYASLAYETHNLTPQVAAATSESATKLGLGYTMDALNVGFAYERTSDNFGTLAANSAGHNAYYLSGKFSISATDAVKAAYTRAGQIGTATTGTGATQFSLGYDHNLSKRTTVYALYTSLKNDTLANYALSNVATSGVNSVSNIGATASAFSFGMKHSF